MAPMAPATAMNRSCPTSTPRLKKSSARGIDCSRRPISREAQTMQQAKDEGDDPGPALGQTWLALMAMYDLCRDKEDAQGDDGFYRLLGNIHQAQRGRRQGDAMRHGKSGDRPDQASPPLDEKQERQNKQQMINTQKDVLNTQVQVGSGYVHPTSYTIHANLQRVAAHYLKLLIICGIRR
jgi:hypothetical protein